MSISLGKRKPIPLTVIYASLSLAIHAFLRNSLHSDRSLVSLSCYYAMIHYKDAGASSAFTNPLKTTSINPPVVTTGRINDNVPVQS
eukprot:scaffold1001_cov191-Alexandrium_tamarense.AAC.6